MSDRREWDVRLAFVGVRGRVGHTLRVTAPDEATAVEIAGLQGGRGHARLVPVATLWVREVTRRPRRTVS